ncbi:hypothetical protein ABT160_41385 [Streptomyces sp. NPDC001941]|uniref:hypothetical protein n=1 Tax=Streptomyces sp. NPDC001941 TaxID=3154659 RepID=UPI003326A980
MIILDTCVLKSTSLRGPEAELLRAISAVGVESFGAPWIVVEELAAQQALSYARKYEAARAAVADLARATPWGGCPYVFGQGPRPVGSCGQGRAEP